MAQSSANTYEENLFAQGERLDSHAVRKQPITAIEYEYRSAEYEYEYEKQPSASRTSRPSYSVRNTDGTRARARTRCSELASMMSDATVMIPTGLESLREPKQPTAAIEYEKCLAPGFSSPPYDNFLVFDKA